jgi:hypothetical protein
MARTPEKLLGAAVIGISAALFVPALIDATGAVSYSATEYSPYLKPIVENYVLILALLALAVLGSFITDQ